MSDENTETILGKLAILESEIKDIKASNDVFAKVSEGYQKAADRVANLAFTVVTASAAVVVLAPAVRAVADYFSR